MARTACSSISWTWWRPAGLIRTWSLGASPRAALCLLRCARARALLDGRHYFTHEDIQAIAPSVLSHRLIIRPEAELEGKKTLDVVNELLHEVPILMALASETTKSALSTGSVSMRDKELGSALGRIPSGLFILTVGQGEAETGMLASWVQQCSFDPPRVSVAIQPQREINTPACKPAMSLCLMSSVLQVQAPDHAFRQRFCP